MMGKIVKIGLDCFGSDQGQIIFLQALKDVSVTDKSLFFYVYGRENEINDYLSKHNINKENIKVIDCKEEILVSEQPVFALRAKRQSSLAIAGDDLKNGFIDCLISAGSTGAVVALAQLYISTLEGVKRPAIAALVPTLNNPMLLLDAGANVDPEAKWLYQYALLGSTYMKEIMGVSNPRVGLLNIGVEEEKGNALTKETHKLLSNDKNINFIGNVEAREVSTGVCDLLVTDAFSGNIVLKMYEGTAKNLMKLIKSAIKSNIVASIGGLLIKNTLKKSMSIYDLSNHGGAPLIGSSKLIIKCHGSSKSAEIKNAILEAKKFVEVDLIHRFSDSLKGANYGI